MTTIKSAKEIKIVFHRPALWWLVKTFFWHYDFERAYFTFGDTMYTKETPPYYIVVHEEVHCKQMRYSRAYACYHFLKYRLSRKYRLASEVEAFRAEYNEITRVLPHSTAHTAHALAVNLSSLLYGDICTYKEAYNAIQNDIIIS